MQAPANRRYSFSLLVLIHKPKSVLVTGGAGFIGSNYLRMMVGRYPEVRFVNLDALTYAGNLLNLAGLDDFENYLFVKGDIVDAATVQALFHEHRFSTVVHFAAESHVDRSIEQPLSFVQTNVMGTAVLLDLARKAWGVQPDPTKHRFHHVSTDEVFGSLGDDGVFEEDSRYAPRSPYAASKASSDHFARAYSETYGLPVVISNCSNNYGPYQFPEKLIPLVITNAAREKPIPVYGVGDNVRDWLFVGDHCEALDLVLRRGTQGATYLIGGNAEMSNLSLVETVVDLVDDILGRDQGFGRRLIRFVADRPGHDYRYAVDASRMRTELGWEPAHALEDGLRSTVEWYLENQDWLDSIGDESYQTYYDNMYGDRLRNSE